MPFGLVKMAPDGGGEMELATRGTNARSAITETPIDMPRR